MLPIKNTRSNLLAIVFAAILVLFSGQFAHAADVILQWDANTETDLAGYKVYYGTVSHNYSDSVDVGNVTSYMIAGLVEGQTYYFAVTAYDNQNNESSYSNEISYTIPAVDTDGDGLSDTDEINVYGTDPNAADSDQDGLSDGDEINNYGTDPNAVDTDSDGINDGDEINIYGTNPNTDDTDQDGIIDSEEINTYGTNPNSADTDQDGLTDFDEINTYGTDPNAVDTDQDGMNDGDEITNGYDPLVDDSSSHPGNRAPDKPVLSQPDNGRLEVTLVPVLQTGTYSEADGDGHAATQWQISTESDFSYIVYNLKTDRYLTSLPVPESVLDTDTTYYWRVKFYDSRNTESDWADAYSFRTIQQSIVDLNNNGTPDDQEVDASVDLDEDNTPDIDQPLLKSVNTVVGGGKIGIKASNNVSSIETLISMDADMIADSVRKPARMPYGVVSFKIFVDNPGDTAYITVHFSEPAAPDAKWHKYDLKNGWMEYTGNVTFSPNRKKVTVRLTDGGTGDADGAVNGVIVDPSGLSASTGVGADGGEDVLKSCFIGAASTTPPVRGLAGSFTGTGQKTFAAAALVILGFIGMAVAIDRRRRTETGKLHR